MNELTACTSHTVVLMSFYLFVINIPLPMDHLFNLYGAGRIQACHIFHQKCLRDPDKCVKHKLCRFRLLNHRKLLS